MSDNGLPTEPVTTSGTKDSRRNRGARIRTGDLLLPKPKTSAHQR